MDLHVYLIESGLPLWFLVLALFLPRLSLFLLWLGGALVRFNLVFPIPLILWIFLPRVLVLIMIYAWQGISLWFIIHLVAAIMVWGGSGNYHRRRWRRREDF